MRDPKLVAELNDTSFGPAVGFVLSTEWDDPSLSGNSLTYTAPTGCDDSMDVDWQVPSLGPSWDDQISSYRVFSNCLVKHWEHRHFAGMSIGFDSCSSDMGEMENRTSSIQWA